MISRKKYPNIYLNICEYPDKPIEKLLLDEKVDLGFIAGPINTTLYEATFSHHPNIV